MPEISEFPLQELLDDLKASLEDIGYCERALQLGILTYRGEGGKPSSVAARLKGNRQIIEVIQTELARRQILEAKP